MEFEYQASEITDNQKLSNKPENLKACLQAGIIPNAHKGILTDVEITEVRRRMISISDSDILLMSPDEMRKKALEGFFVRDAERNLVYCPQGEILRQKSVKRNGYIRYCNKLACKRCKTKCTTSKFKEADFYKDILIKPAGARRNHEPKDKECTPKQPRTTVLKKIVRYVLHLDQKKMENRKC